MHPPARFALPPIRSRRREVAARWLWFEPSRAHPCVANYMIRGMKAVLMHQHGGPEVLRYEEVPDPIAAPGEVLVRVRACALNHLDIWTRMGQAGRNVPLPHVLGNDIAGEVAALRAPV